MMKKPILLIAAFCFSTVLFTACGEKPHRNYNNNPPVILSKKDAGSVKSFLTGPGMQKKITVTKTQN